ncbi:MAG: outer membrane beta-barrel protein [Fermentimonas sp.]
MSTRPQQQVSTSRSITGKLVDQETEQPIPQANIRVLRQADSTFVTGKASSDDGFFSIPVRDGSYIVQISFIGYHDLFEEVQISQSNPQAKLGTLPMVRDDIILSETVVTAKAPEIVVKGDTLEYNAASYNLTESAVVEDLLKKMPGVEVDSEGRITVNGKEITKILVDGEEFFSSDPKVASKNLPAKMVDRLQVLERKTEMAQMTGFDDGEEENVINLTVLPGMKEGLFGNAFAGYGNKKRYETNGMVNYMKDSDQYTFLGGINNTNNAGFSDLATSMFGGMGGRGGRGGRGMMFGRQDGISTSANGGGNFSKQFAPNFKLGGNVRYGYTDNDVRSGVFTRNLLSAGNTLEQENNVTNNRSQNFNMELRMEWEPDSFTTIIFRPNVSLYNNKRDETGDYYTRRESDSDTINQGDSKYFSEGNGTNFGGNIDFSRQIGRHGRVISAQLRANRGDSENSGSNLSNTYYFGSRPDDIINQRFTNTNNNTSWRAFFSYVEPIGRDNYIQLAYQYRQNLSESDKDTRSLDDLGNYTVLDSAYSKRLENHFSNQEVEFNFRSVRENYDYTVGFSVQPSSSRSKTFIGTKQIHDTKQNVVNYAPMAQFNYRWNRTRNLRLRYFGNTDQPSVMQLSPVVDVSDPLNVSYGNPNLKPSFSHRLHFQYRTSNPEKASSFTTFANMSYMTNDIVSSTITDPSTGRKESTFKNVSGNWNSNGRVMFNVPLRNIKFSIFSMSFASYSRSNGFSGYYTKESDEPVIEKNLNQRINLMETLGLNYRSDQFDLSIRGNVNFNNVTNSLEGQRDQQYVNYGGSANASIFLPWDLTIESDINYATNSGYTDGFELNEWLWNASIQKQLFKQKNGTIRLKVYDILQQRSNISRSVTSNYIRDSTTNTLTSYFMVHFVYRFTMFKGGATQEDMMPPRRGDGRGGGMGRGRGFGPPPHGR